MIKGSAKTLFSTSFHSFHSNVFCISKFTNNSHNINKKKGKSLTQFCNGITKIQQRNYSGDYKKMLVFDRQLKRKQKDMSASKEYSKEYDYLRDEVGLRLLDRLNDIQERIYPQAVDLGSGLSPQLIDILKAHTENPPIQTHLSYNTLVRDEVEGDGVIRIQADEEWIPIKDNSVDIVISNLSLHWVNDLPGSLIQIRRCLKPDGLFLGTIFGETTLAELRDSFTVCEQEREGGVSPHVSPFTRITDAGNLLTRAGFQLPTVDYEEIQIHYPSAFCLMNEIGKMGESNAVIARRHRVPFDTMLATAAFYQQHFGKPDGFVPATFQIIYMIGWAPHESQPKAKKRGSATLSLKDLENVERLESA